MEGKLTNQETVTELVEAYNDPSGSFLYSAA
jgi:hypothetical protein